MSILLAAAMTAALASPVDPQPQQRVAPRGSYAQSCAGAYVNQGRLYADCRDREGRIRGTSIELARCSGDDIRNDDGRLACGRSQGDYEGGRPGYPGGPGRPPGGGWGGWGGGDRGSITVFEDAYFRGRAVTFDREMVNLEGVGLNDRISSVRLRGQWEVCSDAYFRGVCRIIDGDESDLSRTGFNDRISSMRPARGRW